MASLRLHLVGAILTAVVILGIIGGTITAAEDASETADAYCQETYGDQLRNTVFVDEGRTFVLHCELENGTLVDVPDRAFS